MYTLYYWNKNLQQLSLKADSLDEPITIPEDLIFTNIRKGINFIKEPHECINLTDLERLIINSEFFDASILKDSDFRKQNSVLTALCQIDLPSELLHIESYYEDGFKKFDVINSSFDFANKIFFSTSIDYGETWVTNELTLDSMGDFSINLSPYVNFYYIFIPSSFPVGIVKLLNEEGTLISNVFAVGG